MRVCLFFAALVLAGCGGDTTTSVPADLSVAASGGDQAVYSLCGHPGDNGNSKGVGKYCMDSMMCNGQMASVCSTLMAVPQGPVYFCTLPCDPHSTTAQCGENATCTCLDPKNPLLCGCVPDECRVGLFG
jgi:hypothetical protein